MAGSKCAGARRAKRSLLNGNTVELDDKVGVIADDHAVESLAGIMGGDSTAVSLDTQNVYVEAAFWHPLAIQGRGAATTSPPTPGTALSVAWTGRRSRRTWIASAR